jgi:hypothetical protein
MATLPASTVATSPTATEGDVKNFLTDQRAFLSDLLGTDSANKAAVLALLGAVMNGSLPKSSGYTIVAADRGKVITASNTITLNITAAATLGDGFVFGVWNVGTGTVTIDPNLTEQINGAATITVLPGKMALIYCNGTAFIAVSSFALDDLLALDGAGSGIDADLLDGQHGSYYAPASGGNYVSKDVGAAGVGLVTACRNIGVGTVANNATVLGAYLYSGRISASGAWVDGPALSGTWRNVSGVSVPLNEVGFFQRIS